MRVRVCVCVRVSLCVSVCLCLCACVCVHICMYTYVYIYIYTYTHAYMYMCALCRNPENYTELQLATLTPNDSTQSPCPEPSMKSPSPKSTPVAVRNTVKLAPTLSHSLSVPAVSGRSTTSGRTCSRWPRQTATNKGEDLEACFTH